ncbi:unnamed protein product, partial [Mesorhabditis belari]|uniref:RNA-binding protein 12 n=1 Tax=Mesorhabditis belari TaxID=2138241 RepID=A0AAF3FGN7_9BILA
MASSSAIIVRLKGLPLSARAGDVRAFFSALRIPEGGVHIVGGPEGDCFIAFSNDEDARQAFQKDRQHIHGEEVRLLFSSRNEMNEVIARARAGALATKVPVVATPRATSPPAYARGAPYEPVYPQTTAQPKPIANSGPKYQQEESPAWNGLTAYNGPATTENAYRQEPKYSQQMPSGQQPKHTYQQENVDSFQQSQPNTYRQNYPVNGPRGLNAPSQRQVLLSPPNKNEHSSRENGTTLKPENVQFALNSAFASADHSHFEQKTLTATSVPGAFGGPGSSQQHPGAAPFDRSQMPPFKSPPFAPKGQESITSPTISNLTTNRSPIAQPQKSESWKKPEHEILPSIPAIPQRVNLPPPPINGQLPWPPGRLPPTPAFPMAGPPMNGLPPVLPPNRPVAPPGPIGLRPPPVFPQYVELTRLPTEMLRPTTLEEWIRPSISLKLSSVKVVYDHNGIHLHSLVKLECFKDAQDILARNNELGIKVRKTTQEAFDSAVDGIPADRHRDGPMERDHDRRSPDRRRRRSRSPPRRRRSPARRRSRSPRDGRGWKGRDRRDRSRSPRQRSRSPRRHRRMTSRTPSPSKPHLDDDPNRFMIQANNVPFKCKDYEFREWLGGKSKFAKRTAFEDGNASDRWICEFRTKDEMDEALKKDREFCQGRRIRLKWIGSFEADKYLQIRDRFGEQKTIEYTMKAMAEQGLDDVACDPTKFGAFSAPSIPMLAPMMREPGRPVFSVGPPMFGGPPCPPGPGMGIGGIPQFHGPPGPMPAPLMDFAHFGRGSGGPVSGFRGRGGRGRGGNFGTPGNRPLWGENQNMPHGFDRRGNGRGRGFGLGRGNHFSSRPNGSNSEDGGIGGNDVVQKIEIGESITGELGPPGTVIISSGFDNGVCMEDVMNFFNGFPIEQPSVRIRMDDKAVPTGECMLAMANTEAAHNAAAKLNGKMFKANAISVALAI